MAPGLLDYTPEERARIAAHGPWPPVVARGAGHDTGEDASNVHQTQAAAIAFGRLLFNAPRLSADGLVSCASCHVPALAFQDGQTVPRVRAGAAASVRNTPSLLDSAQRRWLGWGGSHDSLWAASLAPLLAPLEMGHSAGAQQSLTHLARRVRSAPDLASGYAHALGTLPVDDEALAVGVAKALAAFQATLWSPRTAFDDFRDALMRGDSRAAAAYPPAAQRGLRLFIGQARCSVCHAGAAFTNGEFADIGVPFFVPGGVDGGRHAGLNSLLASPYTRLGAHSHAAPGADPRAVTTRHVVQEHRHFGEFRVPGLRGLARTAPYMHNGSLPTLNAVVLHYSDLNEERLHADGERILRPLKFSAAEQADLLAFLLSLSP